MQLVSPFAAQPTAQHSHPLLAKAGIHAPTSYNQHAAHSQELPSPPPADNPQRREGLMQWHISGVPSITPSEAQPTSPSSPGPSRISDVSSLTSYTGVPPWPQHSPAAGPSDNPSRPSSEYLYRSPPNADSPAGPSSGWMQASTANGVPAGSSSGCGQDIAERRSLAGPGNGWVQAPWGSRDRDGDPARHSRGMMRHGPAGASGSPCSLVGKGSMDPSYREWVPESTTLQEARRLMSGGPEPSPSHVETTGRRCSL